MNYQAPKRTVHELKPTRELPDSLNTFFIEIIKTIKENIAPALPTSQVSNLEGGEELPTHLIPTFLQMQKHYSLY